ncbi:hypothetical protein FHE66_12825 [Georgenia sp. 311]|uniref:hypothetical protein n=1 Tax=Georgenia sp. 311 TaxID=2585134 RepID=UPI001111A08A|nr:hypothetical protein [Georgenia sp. 311]TNC16930.1 hypothetical protein FHE66_12825 [Georgenia sp. 311]
MDEDEALARLRAADPAAGAEPDAERLAERTAEHRGDELAARRERRTPRWAAVAAVAAGALVVGGAGFGIGRAATDAPAPQAGTGQVATTPETMAGGGEARASADMSFSGGMGGRTTFTAQGLGDERSTAAAWALDAAGTVSAETASRAAEVLGVEGEPRQEGGWIVGPVDGNGPTVEIGNDGNASVWFYDPAIDELLTDVEPMPLPEPAEGSAAEEGMSSSSGDAGVPDVAPAEPTGEGPEADAATDGPGAVLRETLAALGVDAEAAEYEVQPHWSGGELQSVVAHQTAGGARTGLMWNAEVAGDRVYTLSGPLAPLVPLGDYEVVSPTEAVARLGDPRFGGSEVWRDDVMRIMPAPDERDWNAPPAAPPAAGDPIPWSVTDVTITAAELGLIEHWTDGDAALLLPAYELSDADGRTWRVLAVADEQLAF